MGFTWDRAYVVDGGKFTRRFAFVPTPFEVGVTATVSAFATSRPIDVQVAQGTA